MSTKKFEDDLTTVLRRVSRLKAALAGDAKITKVEVGSCQVKAHKRQAYTRYVITIGKK